MAGLNDYDCEGELTISALSMNRPAWAVLADDEGNGGLMQLLTDVAQRGEDRRLPSATGVIPFQRRVDVSTYELRLLVVGSVNFNGVETTEGANPLWYNVNWTLELNLNYIMGNIIAPTGTGDGTRPAVWTSAHGTVRSANVHVTGLRQKNYYLAGPDDPHALWIGDLLISVPGGQFT